MSKDILLGNREEHLPDGNPKFIEDQIGKICHYVKYVFVGSDIHAKPFALIIPNKKLLNEPDYEKTPELGCFCPRTLNELGRCLAGCLRQSEFEGKADLESALILNGDFPDDWTREQVYTKYLKLLEEKIEVNVTHNEDFYWVNLKQT